MTEFLLARIAEDEDAARAAWQSRVRVFSPESVDHYSRWDPARVLAECEAKRRIMALHGPEVPICMDGYVEGATHERVINSQMLNGVPSGYCDTLRALAEPYASHEDYQQEWKP